MVTTWKEVVLRGGVPDARTALFSKPLLSKYIRESAILLFLFHSSHLFPLVEK